MKDSDPKDIDLLPDSGGRPIEIGELRICRRCGLAYGPWHYPFGENAGAVWYQACRCPGRPAATKPPNLDIRTVAELCKCCGAEFVPSGLKYSGWFCSDCKERAVELARVLGFWLVPIGRHSLIHGILLTPRDPVTTEVVERFASGFRALCIRMDWLDDWVKQSLPSRLSALGLAVHQDPKLTDYLHALSFTWVDKDREFNRLRDYFLERFIGPQRTESRPPPKRRNHHVILGAWALFSCAFWYTWHFLAPLVVNPATAPSTFDDFSDCGLWLKAIVAAIAAVRFERWYSRRARN